MSDNEYDEEELIGLSEDGIVNWADVEAGAVMIPGPTWYSHRSGIHRPPSPTSNPYVRWGDTIRVPYGAIQTLESREFQRIQLPRPALCRLNLHFEAQDVLANASVEFSAITYVLGVGSSAASIRRVFLAQPQVGSPAQPAGTELDIDLYVTVETLNARVEARAVNCTVAFTLMLTPVALEDLRVAP